MRDHDMEPIDGFRARTVSLSLCPRSETTDAFPLRMILHLVFATSPKLPIVSRVSVSRRLT